MADPKYANLPGLAPDDEPDTFETDDRPEVDQDIDYEENSDAVERLHLSVSDAYSTFKDKNLDGRRADFSDRLRQSRNTGYAAHSGQWELAGEGEPETVLQKYQRLKLELQQLDQEITGMQAGLKEGAAGADTSAGHISSDLERMQRGLDGVDLEALLGAEVLSSLANPEGALRSQLEQQLSQLAAGSDAPPAAAEPSARPQPAPGQQAGAIAALDGRLQAMERAVGAAPDKMSRLAAETRHKSLLAAVASLSSKVALLDPATLEAAEGRLQALHQRMNQVAESKQEAVPQDKLTAISELHDMMEKTSAIQSELPTILDRLSSLETLHDQALNFSRALSELETAQERTEASLSQGEAQLKQAETDCAATLSSVQKGLHTLSARLDAIKK